MSWSFPKQILVALIVVSWIGSYPLMKYGNAEVIRAAVAGAILATINVLLGYAAIEYSIGKSSATFVIYVFGGMGVRLFGMTGILLVMLKVLGFDVVALVASLGIFYVIFLTMEIIYIQKRMSTTHISNRE